MYTETNFKSKKELKAAVASGQDIRIFAPGLGTPKVNGSESVCGPHYPRPHSWYATVTMTDGRVTSVK